MGQQPVSVCLSSLTRRETRWRQAVMEPEHGACSGHLWGEGGEAGRSERGAWRSQARQPRCRRFFLEPGDRLGGLSEHSGLERLEHLAARQPGGLCECCGGAVQCAGEHLGQRMGSEWPADGGAREKRRPLQPDSSRAECGTRPVRLALSSCCGFQSNGPDSHFRWQPASKFRRLAIEKVSLVPTLASPGSPPRPQGGFSDGETEAKKTDRRTHRGGDREEGRGLPAHLATLKADGALDGLVGVWPFVLVLSTGVFKC